MSQDLWKEPKFCGKRAQTAPPFSKARLINIPGWILVPPYLPNEMTAAFLMAQLEAEESITKSRVNACIKYFNNLKPLHDAGKIKLYD